MPTLKTIRPDESVGPFPTEARNAPVSQDRFCGLVLGVRIYCGSAPTAAFGTSLGTPSRGLLRGKFCADNDPRAVDFDDAVEHQVGAGLASSCGFVLYVVDAG